MATYAEDLKSTAYIHIKPKICISASETTLCETTVIAAWGYHYPVTVCLHSDVHDYALACWAQAQQGEVEFSIASREDVQLRLLSVETKKILLQTKIQVLSKRLHIKRLRRGKRHIWSIF